MTVRYLGVSLLAIVAVAAHAEPPTEVIVQGQRFAPYSGDAVFSRVDLTGTQLTGGASLDQVLKQTAQASLFRRSSSLTANPTVQGMSLRAIAPSGAGRALVTLEGIPQNDPFGGWVIWPGIPTEGLSSAHVVRGAGGGAYGAGALTGVVDLSLVPPQALRPYIQASIDNHDGGGLQAGFAMGNHIGVHLTDRTLEGDIPVRGSQRGAADVATHGRDRSLLINGQWAVAEGELSLLAGGYDSMRETGLKGAVARSKGDQISLAWTRQPTAEALGYRLQIWHKDSDLSNRSVSVLPGRSGTSLANDQVRTPATGDGFNAAIRHQTLHSEWEIGIDARTGEGESREYYRYMSGAATRYRVSGGENTLAGLYGQGTRTIDRWTLTGAVRIDDWKTSGAHRFERDLTTGLPVLDLDLSSKQQTVGSGRLGVAYQVSPQNTLRAAIYSGFRPPSLNELYRPFRVGNDVTEANADLKPETLTGGEIGWRRSGQRLHLDADIFSNVVSDPITNVTLGIGPSTFPVAGFIPAGGAYRQRRNVGEIRAYGLEAQAQYQVSDALALNAALTATHARVGQADTVVNGKRPAQAPDYSASVGAEGQMAKIGWRADWLFEGESFEDDLNALPLKPYSKLNLVLDYPLTPQVSLGLRVDNAFDTAIQIQRSNDGTVSFDTSRMVTLGLSYRH
ncbi:TonB-dependent receptor [Asticcacaulis taihuensis]|uniref:TonB-dependent receptor n=1 Tax=Asticcacaulis taihuensis TaxID=260084 RepID=UPI0026F2BD93|nr:TonB-dependent receptor [Asticcacaulis taihuensis]